MRMSAPIRIRATDLAAQKIKRGVVPSMAIFQAIEEAGGDPVDSFNRSEIGRQLSKRSIAKRRLAKRQAETLDKEVKEIARSVPTEAERTAWLKLDARRLGESEEE